MLDKSKLYRTDRHGDQIVRILFEDDISYYVEHVGGRVDRHDNPIRLSAKKTFCSLIEVKKKIIVYAKEVRLKAYEVEINENYPGEAADMVEVFRSDGIYSLYVKRNARLDKITEG